MLSIWRPETDTVFIQMEDFLARMSFGNEVRYGRILKFYIEIKKTMVTSVFQVANGFFIKGWHSVHHRVVSV